MSKPIGGRGKKAPYETIPVRVPVPIKAEVETLIERYRDSVLSDETTTRTDSSSAAIEHCMKLVENFIKESNQTDKLHTRNNVNLIRFRNWLETLKSNDESDTLWISRKKCASERS